jgi:cation:H+ antiporter
MSFFLFFVGFYILIKGASLFVSSASSFAKYFKISDFVIGLTVIAFGTSLPELIVGLFSASSGSGDIALSNVLGSNIANIFLILGICALVRPLSVTSYIIKTEIPYSLFVTFWLFLLLFDSLVRNAEYNILSRLDGSILLIIFAFFLYFIVVKQKEEEIIASSPEYSLLKSIILLVFGGILIFLGGEFIITGATDIAIFFGVPESIIGVTLVAFGTSLPELSTSLIALKQGKSDMVLGNIFGSNVFNILLILGSVSVFFPFTVYEGALRDILFAFAAPVLLFFLVFRNGSFSFFKGIFFLFVYAFYLSILFIF